MDVMDLFARVVLDTSEYEAGLEQASRETTAFGDVLKANLASDAIVGAVKKISSAVVDIGKSAFESYGEYEQLVGGAQLMFGDAYDFVAERAKSAYKNVQMSQNDYLRQVNGFATGLKTAMGGNARAAAELADKIVTAQADVVAATGAAQDMVQNAFVGIMRNNYTMLDNLQLGITPTKEGFQSLIDSVNEWNAENGKMTDYTIENLADCQSALIDYIEQQGLAGYAAMEASGTIQGSVASMKSAWEDLLAGLGKSDSDIDQLTENFLDSLQNVLDQSTPIVQEITENIVDAIGKTINKARDSNKQVDLAFDLLEKLGVLAAGFTLAKVVRAFTDTYSAAKTLVDLFVSSKLLQGGAAFTAFATTAVKETNSFVSGAKEGIESLTKNDGTIESVREALDSVNSKIAEMEEHGMGLFDYMTIPDFVTAKVQMSELKAQSAELERQLEELTTAENVLAESTGNLTQSVDADTIITAAQEFASATEQIMTSYWDTYNSIYTGLYSASTLFTQVMEATQFGSEDETGASAIRKSIEANTRFYETYASDLEYVTGAAEDAGADISGLNEILAAMGTEDAAGAIAAIRQELELVGDTSFGAQKNVIENWQSLIEDYATAVGAATTPLAEAVTGVNEQLDSVFQQYSDTVSGLDMSAEAEAAGKATMDALAFGISENSTGVLSQLDLLIEEIQRTLSNGLGNFQTNISAMVGLKPSGSHKSGLDYVPYDGYIAQLHQGERVLTAEEANASRTGGGNGGTRTDDIRIVIPVTLDGEEIGRAAYQYAFSEDRRRGV